MALAVGQARGVSLNSRRLSCAVLLGLLVFCGASPADDEKPGSSQLLIKGKHANLVDFVEADILTWTWPVAAYDAVVGIFIQFTTAAERPRQLAGMKAAVKPGGLVLLQGYTPKQLDYRTGGPSSVENLYTREMLLECFDDWRILHLREHDDDLSEGSAHLGRSALIDLVAERPTGK